MITLSDDRRKYPRYKIENSIVINADGVFQLVDVSKGGFGFKCALDTSIADQWLSDILTPIKNLLGCLSEKIWQTVYVNPDSDLPMLVHVGVKFNQLTIDQKSNLEECLDSIDLLSCN
jgi:hypothetical protein